MLLNKENSIPETVVEPGAKEFQVASDVKSPTNGKPLLAGKNVGVVLFSYYLSDPRPRRSAEILARHGANVEVICLRSSKDEPRRETVNGVKIHRLPLKRQRGGKASYVYQYAAFILAAMVLLAARSFRRRCHLVHAHNMPDALVFSALVPKLLGAKVILDLHDPMPELMMTIFGLRQDSLVVRLLKQTEKWSVGFANLVLTPNISFKKLFVSRGCPPGKIDIVMNSPNEELFHFRPAPASVAPRDPARPFEVLYHGSLVARHGLDLAIDALELVRKSIPNATITICGESTPYFEQIMNTVRERGLQEAIHYLGMRNHRQIVEAIERCDLGVIPNRRSVFTEINMPTRIFEYLVLGKPAVAPRTQGIQDYFGEQDLIFFEPDNVADLAKKIEFAALHAEEARAIIERGQAIYQQHRWGLESSSFVKWTCGIMGITDKQTT